MLCGAHSGNELLGSLRNFITEERIPDEKRKEFRNQTYTKQDNYVGLSECRRILNYFVSYQYRERLIDLVILDLNFLLQESKFYVPLENLVEMELAGNIIGSHSVSHPVMSKLSKLEQHGEIENSFSFLEKNLQLDMGTYCHPYGGFHSFNEDTLNILADREVAFSFNVESRDICDKDLLLSIQSLPRYDCNEVPFGTAS